MKGASFQGAKIPFPQTKLPEIECEQFCYNRGTRFGADVSSVDFGDAKLTGVNFQSSDITDAQIDQAYDWEGAIIPDEMARRKRYKNPVYVGGVANDDSDCRRRCRGGWRVERVPYALDGIERKRSLYGSSEIREEEK
ncbi:MAG: hypothetical protein F4181_12460 [Proteobacteria bacterium]|nr:hypothetical protein [Pseudomonadota bacterium]